MLVRFSQLSHSYLIFTCPKNTRFYKVPITVISVFPLVEMLSLVRFRFSQALLSFAKSAGQFKFQVL